MNTNMDYHQLPVSERIQLVEDIWDSIADEGGYSLRLTEEEKAEFQRRLDDHQKDPSSSRSWEEVRESLFSGDR
jgi:putative addiction module component (TIGR02574 family)